MIKVYHRKIPLGRVVDAGNDGDFPDDYQLVANVNTTTLEHAYELTNNITGSWTDNVEVIPEKIASHGCRSTMIGDILVDSFNNKYVVRAIGFTRYRGLRG